MILGAHDETGPLHGGKGKVSAGAVVGRFLGQGLTGSKGLRSGRWGALGFLFISLKKVLTSGGWRAWTMKTGGGGVGHQGCGFASIDLRSGRAATGDHMTERWMTKRSGRGAERRGSVSLRAESASRTWIHGRFYDRGMVSLQGHAVRNEIRQGNLGHGTRRFISRLMVNLLRPNGAKKPGRPRGEPNGRWSWSTGGWFCQYRIAMVGGGFPSLSSPGGLRHCWSFFLGTFSPAEGRLEG